MVRAVLLKQVVCYRLGSWALELSRCLQALVQGWFLTVLCLQVGSFLHPAQIPCFLQPLALHLVLCTCVIYSRSWSALKSQQGSFCQGNTSASLQRLQHLACAYAQQCQHLKEEKAVSSQHLGCAAREPPLEGPDQHSTAGPVTLGQGECAS